MFKQLIDEEVQKGLHYALVHMLGTEKGEKLYAGMQTDAGVNTMISALETTASAAVDTAVAQVAEKSPIAATALALAEPLMDAANPEASSNV